MRTHYYETFSLNTFVIILLYMLPWKVTVRSYVSIEGDGRNIICYHEGNESPWRRRSKYV